MVMHLLKRTIQLASKYFQNSRNSVSVGLFLKILFMTCTGSPSTAAFNLFGLWTPYKNFPIFCGPPPINRNTKFRILWTTKGSMDPRLGTTALVTHISTQISINI